MASSGKMHRCGKKTKEASVEGYLVSECARLGFVVIKLNPRWLIGIPDRLVVLQGRVVFVELKRPVGGKLSVAQEMWKNRLTALGCEWHLLCTREEVDRFLEG